MVGEVFKGEVKDVVAELRREVERFGNISVEKWIRIRNLERAEAKQLGVTHKEFIYETY